MSTFNVKFHIKLLFMVLQIEITLAILKTF